MKLLNFMIKLNETKRNETKHKITFMRSMPIISSGIVEDLSFETLLHIELGWRTDPKMKKANDN